MSHTSIINAPERPDPISDLDVRFDALVDELRRDFRRFRGSLDEFARILAERAAAAGDDPPDDPTRRAHRRLRELQQVLLTLESSAAYLGGSGLAPSGTYDEAADTARRIHDGLESERARLSREIHDGPAQVLANAVFEIEYLERVAGRAHTEVRAPLLAELASLKQTFRTSLDSVRAMIYDLRPPELARLGLAEALRTYAAEFEARTGLAVACHLDAAGTGLLPLQELTAYRIVQEALQNVHKHARALHIRLALQRSQTGWTLTCVDDGVGFDLMRAASDPRHVGLAVMRERAELAGGTLAVRSTVGAGTTITLAIPLPGGRQE